MSTSLQITSIVFTVLQAILLATVEGEIDNDFITGSCPNGCSYQQHQVRRIRCNENQTIQAQLVEISMETVHLVVEQCEKLHHLNINEGSNIRSLTLAHSKIPSKPENLFKSLGNIHCLKLINVTFSYLQNDLFEHFKNLEYIEFEKTYLKQQNLIHFLSEFGRDSNLKSLVLSKDFLAGSSVHEKLDLNVILKPLESAKLTCFTLQNQSHFEIIMPKIRHIAKDLVIFNIKYCYDYGLHQIWNFAQLLLHNNLKIIDCSYYNNILVYPQNVPLPRPRQKRSMGLREQFLELTERYIREQNFSFINECEYSYLVTPGIFPNLEEVYFPGGAYSLEKTDHPICVFFQGIVTKIIDISDSPMVQKFLGMRMILHGLDALEYLNVQNNDLDEGPMIFFHFMPNLKVLLLGHNKLARFIDADLNGTFFSQLTSLRVLDLAFNNIKVLPYKAFVGLKSLEILNLTENRISMFEVDLSIITNQIFINLNSNIIDKLSSEATSMLDILLKRIPRNSNGSTSGPITMDLRMNPFTCNCIDLDFIEWFQSTNVKFTDGDSYKCKNINGEIESLKNVDFRSWKSICNPLTTGEMAGIGCSLFLAIFTPLCVVVVYKKRHQWRYWVFRMYYYRRKAEEPGDYKYDAYVCYSSLDHEWVHTVLQPTLEEQHNFRLCLDQRDFPGGNFITNNILEGIEESRKTLLILSPNFAESHWCIYEMNMAYTKFLYEGKDIIIPVIFEPIESKHMDRTMKSILKKKTYIELTSSEDSVFWNHLVLALSEQHRDIRINTIT